MQSKVGNVFIAAETAERLGKDGIINVVCFPEAHFDIKHALTLYCTERQSRTAEDRAAAPCVNHSAHDHGRTRSFSCLLDASCLFESFFV